MGQVATVKISEVRENKVHLRGVNRESEAYRGLVQSMRNMGFTGAITVRQNKDPETGKDYLELVDGAQRLQAAKDAGLTEINVDIKNLDEQGVLVAQILTNAHRVETKPYQYSDQLRRILILRPTMTEMELASSLGKSAQWIKERLQLVKIQNTKIQALIDEGKIKLTNACKLAKLPVEEQEDWLDRAMTLSPSEFLPQADARIKEVADAKRKGRAAAPAGFQAVMFLRKVSDIKQEITTPAVCDNLLKENKVKTPAEAFALALKWVMNFDPGSISAQRVEYDKRQQLAAEAKKKKAAERAKDRAEAAAAAAAAVVVS